MASLAPPSIRPHPGEQARARGFGSSAPDFFGISLFDNPFRFMSEGDGTRIIGMRRKRKAPPQPAKLTPAAKRWFVKYRRQARLRMQRGW